MSTHGYIPDEWIISYAAGQLSDAKSLLVATHLDFHQELHDKLQTAEVVGGTLLAERPNETVSEGALDAALAKIDTLPPTVQSQPEISTPFDTPAPLASYLGKNLEDLKWGFMGPGMKKVKLWSSADGESFWLLRAKGGTQIPLHDHRGTELTLTLKGSYTVGGRRFKQGDIEIADTAISNHQPMIDEGEDCICLVVTDAPIRLHSMLGRMVQPFIGV